MPAAAGVATSNEQNLGRQNSNGVLFFDQYKGAGGSGAPTYSVTAGYIPTDGFNGAIYWDLWENDVAGSGAIIIEGTDLLTVSAAAYTGALWVPVGYYTIVANGTTGTTLTRAASAVTLTTNTLTRLQCLDAYTYMRARVTSNASSASLSAYCYMVAA